MSKEILFKQSQHFIPRSFLKGFTKQDDGWLQELDLKNNQIRKKHIGKVCCVDNFYDIEKEELLERHGLNNARFLETSFTYENRLRKILNQIRNRELYLLRKDFQLIVEAYVGMKHRTPYYRKKLADPLLLNQSFDKVIPEFKEQYGQLLSVFPSFNFDNFAERLRLQILMDKDHPKDTHLQGMIESIQGTYSPVQDAINKIASMNISIFEIRSNDYFLATDNPGYSLDGNKMFNTNYGWFDAIHFPINSKQMIVLRDFDGCNYIRPLIRLNYMTLPTNEISEINRMSILIADEKLFCENRDYLEKYKK